MYDTIDTLSDWKGYIYFISLIFLLAWLVKVQLFPKFIFVLQPSWNEIKIHVVSSMIFTSLSTGHLIIEVILLFFLNDYHILIGQILIGQSTCCHKYI